VLCCVVLRCAALCCALSTTYRQGGWLADFAELGVKAGGTLLSAASTDFADLGARAGSQIMAAAGSTTAGSSTAGAVQPPGGTAAGGGSSSPAAAGSGGGAITGQGPGGSVTGLSGGGGAPLGFSSGGTGSHNLTFRFDLTVSELTPEVSSAAGITAAGGSGAAALAAAAAGGGGGTAAAAAEGSGYGSLLKRGLGQASGGPYLTPAGMIFLLFMAAAFDGCLASCWLSWDAICCSLYQSHNFSRQLQAMHVIPLTAAA
jgi:hypothetical protein